MMTMIEGERREDAGAWLWMAHCQDCSRRSLATRWQADNGATYHLLAVYSNVTCLVNERQRQTSRREVNIGYEIPSY